MSVCKLSLVLKSHRYVRLLVREKNPVLESAKDELETFYGLGPCIKGNPLIFMTPCTSKRQGNSLPSENKDSITIMDNFVVS